MKKAVFTLVVILLFIACSNASKQSNDTVKLKQQKYCIDSLVSGENLLIFVKIPGKENLVKITKGQAYPKQIEMNYNVLLDRNGKLIYAAEIPFSSKDDWFIAYKSYFNSEGKLFAFQRQANFFNSECTKGAAIENLIRFYDNSFTVVDTAYTLTDSDKKPLEKAACTFPYNFAYSIAKTSAAYTLQKGFGTL